MVESMTGTFPFQKLQKFKFVTIDILIYVEFEQVS